MAWQVTLHCTRSQNAGLPWSREESRSGGARHIRICSQPGTLLEMSNLETNGARSEIGLERLNCIQCVRFFVGSPLQYCCVLMLMIGALKFDIWLPKPAQHYSHFVYRDFPGKLWMLSRNFSGDQRVKPFPGQTGWSFLGLEALPLPPSHASFFSPFLFLTVLLEQMNNLPYTYSG